MAKALSEWLTPTQRMRNMEKMNAQLEKCRFPPPQVPEGPISYFGAENKAEKKNQYDLYFSIRETKPIFDPRKRKDNTQYMPCIWESIYQQEKDRPIPFVTSHVYGRPCRQVYDVRETKHVRWEAMKGAKRKNGIFWPEVRA